MSIARKVRSVERVFGHLSAEIADFQATTGLHCFAGCGHCCAKPDIEATPLEFLPFAFDLFLKRNALEVYEQLETNPVNFCIAYAPISLTNADSGSCASYAYRGLICRLFGYAASKNKEGLLVLGTCKRIKTELTDSYIEAQTAIKAGLYVPVYSDYYKRLAQIDFKLGNTFLSINEAIKEAIEAVLHHYSYRPFPHKMRRTA